MPGNKSFYGWKLLFVLWLIYLLNVSFTYFGIPVVTTAMAKDLNFDRSTLGMGFTFLILAMGLPGPFIGHFVNKYGVRLSMILGSIAILLSALYLALFVDTGLEYIIAFGVVMGLGAGYSTVIPAQTGVTLWFNKRRSLALSIIMTASGVGGFIAAPLLNKIINLGNATWRNGWFFVAGTAIVSLILAILFVKNKPSDIGQIPDGIRPDEALLDSKGKTQKVSRVFKTERDMTLKEASKLPSTWILLVGAIVFAWAFQLFLVHGVIHLGDLGFSSEVSAMSLSALIIFTVVGKLGTGFLGDYIEPRYIWSGGFIMTTVAILLVVAPKNLFQVYAYAILLGTGYGCSVICWITSLSNYFGSKYFASILGLQIAFITAASSCSPLLAGLMFDLIGSYKIIFLSSAVLSLAGAVFILFALPPKVNVISLKSSAETA